MQPHWRMVYQDIITGNRIIKCKTIKEIEDKIRDLGNMWLTRNETSYGKFLSSEIDRILLNEMDSPSKEQFLTDLLMLMEKTVTVLEKDGVIISHCKKHSYRSILDCFLVAKTYFPETSLEEVYHTILGSKTVYISHCSNVRRVVYSNEMPQVFAEPYLLYREFTDELGVTLKRWTLTDKNDTSYHVTRMKVELSID